MLVAGRWSLVPLVLVRQERGGDYARIAEVVEAAFGRANEARLVEAIRASPHYVAELALVAAAGGEVVGHVMFSYATLHGDDERRVLLLSPLAVVPGQQRQGVGRSLVQAGIALVEARGEPLIVVEGIPAYYPQFGFRRARDYGIEPPTEQVPDAAFMLLPLSTYDPSIRGRMVYPPAFEVT